MMLLTLIKHEKGLIAMNPIIRQAVLGDEEGVFSLASRLATSYVVEREPFSKLFEEVLIDQKSNLFIAHNNAQPIGYVLAFHRPAFYANGEVTWIEELYVDETYRGSGIGKKLMNAVESAATVRGSKLVALATRRASGFYKAIGYTESATYFKKSLD